MSNGLLFVMVEVFNLSVRSKSERSGASGSDQGLLETFYLD